MEVRTVHATSSPTRVRHRARACRRARWLVRRLAGDRPPRAAHPGAQLSFSDHEGHRFQAIPTDQAGEATGIERRHRARAQAEDQIRDDKDTGLPKLPSRSFGRNSVWFELVAIAHYLISWTKSPLLSAELDARSSSGCAASAFPSWLPLRWPWAGELAAAFARLEALPQPTGRARLGRSSQLDRPPSAARPRQVCSRAAPAVGWRPPLPVSAPSASVGCCSPSAWRPNGSQE